MQVTPSNMPNVISHYDSLLMAMYLGRTTLVIDMDEDEVSSAAQSKSD